MKKLLKRFCKRYLRPCPAWERAERLQKDWVASGIWGCGWLPSPLYSIRQARGIAEHYGLIIKYEGSLTIDGQWINWYAWYPKERWIRKPKWHPHAHGQGITLGEAVVRCLLDCLNQGMLGDEKDYLP